MDNLQIIDDRIYTDIDPNGPDESILAKNHQEILWDFLKASGKYVGVSFLAYKQDDVTSPNSMSFEGKGFNDAVQFKFSELDSDNLSTKTKMQFLKKGDLILMKDFVGRAGLFKVINIDLTNEIIIDVEADATNISYTYEDDEVKSIVISFIYDTSNNITELNGISGQVIYDKTEEIKPHSGRIEKYLIQPKKSLYANGSGGSGTASFIYIGFPYVVNSEFSFMMTLNRGQNSSSNRVIDNLSSTYKITAQLDNGFLQVELLGSSQAIDYTFTLGYSNKLGQYFIGVKKTNNNGYHYPRIRVYDFIMDRANNNPEKLSDELKIVMFSEYYGVSSLRIDNTVIIN